MPLGLIDALPGSDGKKMAFLRERHKSQTSEIRQCSRPGSLRPTDRELLENLLRLSPRKDAARALLDRFRTLAAVLTASPQELSAVLEADTADMLKTVHMAMVRMLERDIYCRPILLSLQTTIDWLKLRIGHRRQEVFLALFLDGQGHLIADEEMNQGTVNRIAVYPREVIKRALDLNASAIVLVHNHPDGDPCPSPQDVACTRAIEQAGKCFEIAVHDHIIIGAEGHLSLRSEGFLDDRDEVAPV